MSDVRLVQKDGVAHRLRHTLRPPLPPPLAAVRLVAVGKSYAIHIDAEKTAFAQQSNHRQTGIKIRYLFLSCICR